MPIPPHLKAAQECGDCKYFEAKGQCTMYDFPVSDDEHCDSWVPADVKEAAKRAWANHCRRLERAR